MQTSELENRYPSLYHMCEPGSWPGIMKHGLLSVSGLLDLYGYQGEERKRFEAAWRSDKMTLSHPEHGQIVVRDQKPMPPEVLARCLPGGMTPSDWYRLLNSKTFFWVNMERLQRLLTANAYINQPQWVITVNTRELLKKYSQNVKLSPFNTGFAYDNRSRSIDSFKTIEQWDSALQVVEFAVDYGIPDIANFATNVTEWKGRWVNGHKVCMVIQRIWSN